MNISKFSFQCKSAWFCESNLWTTEGELSRKFGVMKYIVMFLVVLQSAVLLMVYFNPNFLSPFTHFSILGKVKYCFTRDNRLREISEDKNGSYLELENFRDDQTKRQIDESAKDMWLFLNRQLNKLSQFEKELNSTRQSQYKEILNYISQRTGEYHRVIAAELKKLEDDEWKIKEEKELKRIVQSRLHHLQNPENCSTAPLFYCRFTNPWGLASGIDDIMFCLIRAYHSKQMMILETSQWHYHIGGWETMFQPLSDSCSIDDITIPSEIINTVPNGVNIRRLLTKLPRDLGPRLVRIHDNPLAWWYAQFIYYLMRPNEHLKNLIDEISKNMDNGAVVGLHIRRTDKVGTEAISHTVEEYMIHAEDYFLGVELVSSKKVVRQVYVATDDPSVTEELKTKYPSYKFIYNTESVSLASKQSTRYQNASTWGLVADLFILAKCNFIVCTFSSGISRLAYELMQAMQGPDAAIRVHSLDLEYFYAWIPRPRRVAIYDHEAFNKDEMSFLVNDIIYTADGDDHLPMYEARDGKLADGLVIRNNDRTQKKGLVPKYKTRRIYDYEDFPNFNDTENYLEQDAS